MFLQNTYNFFRGFINLRAEGYFVERLLNLCQVNNIRTWDVNIKYSRVIEFKANRKDYKEICELAKKTRSNVEIINEVGIPKIANQYKGRKVFVGAAIFMGALIYFLSLHVWSIEIKGNENISIDEIRNELELQNVKVGMLKSKLDMNTIKRNIYMKRDDVLWLGFDIKGTKMVVEVLERSDPKKDSFENVPCNIVAEKDGVVESIYVKNGTRQVNPGDVVFKGDVLVSGLVTSEYSEDMYVSSSAEIRMKTWYTEKVAVPYQKSILVKSGNVDYDYRLKIRKIWNKFIKYWYKF